MSGYGTEGKAYQEYLNKEGERVASMMQEEMFQFKPLIDRLTEEYTASEDIIKEPSHYQLPKGLEVKDVIEDLTKDLTGWQAVCYGNILKYVLRATKKGSFSQDLMKCKQYIDMMNLA